MENMFLTHKYGAHFPLKGLRIKIVGIGTGTEARYLVHPALHFSEIVDVPDNKKLIEEDGWIYKSCSPVLC